MKLEAFSDAPSFARLKCFVERAELVGVEVVQYQPDHLGIRVGLVHQPPHLKSTAVRRSVTATCLHPPFGIMNRFRVPLAACRVHQPPHLVLHGSAALGHRHMCSELLPSAHGCSNACRRAADEQVPGPVTVQVQLVLTSLTTSASPARAAGLGRTTPATASAVRRSPLIPGSDMRRSVRKLHSFFGKLSPAAVRGSVCFARLSILWCAKSTAVRRSVTATCLHPPFGSQIMNRFRVPLRWYSVS